MSSFQIILISCFANIYPNIVTNINCNNERLSTEIPYYFLLWKLSWV